MGTDQRNAAGAMGPGPLLPGFISAADIRQGSVHSGIAALERLTGIGSGIITLRSKDERWLSGLAYRIIARNIRPDSRILYLQWVEYHERYWTLDHDELVRRAKADGADMDALEENLLIVRAFSKDNNDQSAYWERLMALEGVCLVLLDSVSELYVPDPGRGYADRHGARRPEAGHRTRDTRRMARDRLQAAAERDSGRGTLTGAIGRFVQLCIRLDCPGVILDRKSHPSVHPYLAHVSSVIVDFDRRGSDIRATLLKHPCMADMSEYIPRKGQYTLWKWL